MTLLPIIQRELLVRARSRASRRLRLGAALVGTWVCVPWLLTGASLTPVNGGDLFRTLAGACFILCCACCLFTSDAVGSERREGTLGLLLLTRVRGVDILLGKLGSNGLDALCGLVALLPLLMIPVLMGGTTGWEAGRTGLALLDTLCLALAAGLYESAAHPKQFRATVGAVLLVLALVLLPAIPWWRTALPHFWLLFSPLSAMIRAGDLAYRTSRPEYWACLAFVQAEAWVLVAFASGHLRRAVREGGDAQIESAEVTPRSGLRPPRRIAAEKNPVDWPLFDSGKVFAGLRPIAACENPVQWLVARQRGLRAAIWAAVALSVINSLAGAFLFRMFWFPSYQWPWGVLSGLPWLALHLLAWSLFAWAASRFFIEARRTGELELLLTTPFGAGQVVAGQWRALWRLFLVPALVLALMSNVGTLLPLLALRARSGLAQPEMSYVLSLVALNLVHLALGLAALCWLGLWFGLRSRSQAGAVIWTTTVGQLVPYFLSTFGMLLVWPLRAFLSRLSGPLPLFVYLITWVPQIPILIYFLCMIRWARNRLRRELTRFEPNQFTLRRDSVAPLPSAFSL